MVLVKMLMKIGPPMMRGLLVMLMASISPSQREVSPAESLRRSAKVLLPKFRLQTAALHPKSLLLIFSRANGLIYQKMGTGGWPGAPQATRARLEDGGGAPWCLVGTWVAPSGTSFLQYFLYIQYKNLREISGLLELRRIGISDVAISGPEFQLSAFSLFM